MIVVFFLLAILCIFASRKKGPLWIFSIVWLIPITLISLCIIDYNFFSKDEIRFISVLILYLSCFCAGLALCKLMTPRKRCPTIPLRNDLIRCRGFAYVACGVGIFGSFFLIADFFVYKGVGLNDMSALRDVVVGAPSVSWLARIASVLTWGGLYCLIFMVYFRDQLSRTQLIFFVLPVVGYFFVALLSAGRQAAFQIMIFSLIAFFVKSAVFESSNQKVKKNWLFLIGLCALMILFMGYMAVARNDELISNSKAEVLADLFDFSVAQNFSLFFIFFGEGIYSVVIETLVYFSSPIALFSKFLNIEWSLPYYGVFNFPFVARQLESVTGFSVVDVMAANASLMAGEGVIGVGWTTSFSSLILDFGYVGAGFVLFVQGFFTSLWWRRALCSGEFDAVAKAVVMLVLVVYMPLLSAISDTNIFFLFLYLLLIDLLRRFRFFRSRN